MIIFFPLYKIKINPLDWKFHWKRGGRHFLNWKEGHNNLIYTFELPELRNQWFFLLFFRNNWQVTGIKYRQESKNSHTHLHTHGLTNLFNNSCNHTFIMVDIESIYNFWSLCNYEHMQFFFLSILKSVGCFQEYSKNVSEYQILIFPNEYKHAFI